LVCKSKAEIALGRPGHRWDDNIKIDLKRNVVGGCVPDLFGSIQTMAGSCAQVNEPLGREFLYVNSTSFSEGTLLHGFSYLILLRILFFSATIMA
jgi:hypothetical protein